VAADALLLIHATPAGMKGAGAAPAAAPLVDVAALPAAAAVCDLVYNPLETPLLTAARARGLAIIDGLGMLLHQAAPAFEALYGVRPRVTLALRAELESVLRDKP
jgi:shikimate dehydrogenase